MSDTEAAAAEAAKKSSSSRKRELEEIEIKLEEPTPLSKKQKRLEKKKSKKSQKSKESKDLKDSKESKDPKEPNESKESKESEQSEESNNSNNEASSDSKIKESSKGKSDYGVWIGNMSYDTQKDDIIRYIVAKTASFPQFTEEDPIDNDHLYRITEKDITRVFAPLGKGKKSIKGFAYVDFSGPQFVSAAISLSETQLNGRNLLIKNANSFEGRPAKPVGENASANPPSRILFVGNLSFDTTEDDLTMHFQHCGEILRIRMATFQDTGKCKGFSFIDFRDTEAATNALKDKLCYKLHGRKLRMEYGEDRSKRNPRMLLKQAESGQEEAVEGAGEFRDSGVLENTRRKDSGYAESGYPEKSSTEMAAPVKVSMNSSEKKKKKKTAREKPKIAPGAALANAARGKVGIVESTGKKITF